MERNNHEKLEYNVQQRARAGTAATLRGAVAVYIVYLGVQLIRGALDGTSTLPAWAAWTAGIFFFAAALGFGWYIWRRWRADVEAARIKDENTGEETPDE